MNFVTIGREYKLSCAHQLSHLPPEHKCSHLHGHTYRVIVTFRGNTSATTGMLMDFADIDALWNAKVHAVLDHRFLNDVQGLDMSTAENLAAWIFGAIDRPTFRGTLQAVEVHEGDGGGFARVTAGPYCS